MQPRADGTGRAPTAGGGEVTPPASPGLSLARKLPLQFALVLTVVMLVFTAIAYREVERAARAASADRIQRVNEAFARTAASTQADWRSRAGRAAAAPEAIRFFQERDPDSPGLRSLLDPLVGEDAENVVELWSPDGAPLYSTGAVSSASDHRSNAAALLTMGGSDSARTGPVYETEDGIHFWVVAPVGGEEDTGPLGYLALHREIPAPVAAEATIRELIGPSARIFLTTEEGSPWVGLLGPSPLDEPSRPGIPLGRFTLLDEEGGTWVAHGTQVEGTPWVLVTAQAEPVILGPVRTFLARAGLAALFLLLLGVAAATVVGRHLTQPLRELSTAAERVAAGDYGQRATVSRGDEVGLLGATFNQMAREVQKSHRQLAESNERLRGARSEAERARAEAETAAVRALQARDEAEAANRAKARFLGTMSHEIRTPLSAITGYAEILSKGIAGPLTEDQRKQLDRIRRSSDHLKELVDDLLDLTRVEVGDFDLRPVSADLAEAMEGAVDLARPAAEAAGVTVAATLPSREEIWYVGEPRRVRQILGNLLSNAIKFSSGGEVRLTGGRSQEEDEGSGSRVFVRVEDDGPGIAADETERIFDPFVQLESEHSGSRGGAGLGLPISRQLARLMGGDITVQSEPGVGSTFTLWLPEAAPTTLPLERVPSDRDELEPSVD